MCSGLRLVGGDWPKSPSQVRPYCYIENTKRHYWWCPDCDLVFLDPQQRPDPGSERERYLSHNNDPGDPRYEKYLSLVVQPIIDEKAENSEPVLVLDYGCGPTTGIETLWSGHDLSVESYDPFFYPNLPLEPKHRFDYVISCESAEHFYEPHQDWYKISQLLKPDGKVILRTGWRPPTMEEFKKWGYHHDPTHVCFYSAKTVEWLRQNFKIEIRTVGLWN
ncbi:MAG: methyltransferase domain-containing protein [Bdellovibrionaceae bacterium]|nr:methyltransferase domain-containing protein [Bdellovibrionales bacterium]MCB9083120.1 methyltransferase domain-containing protein [Pseudobdellovibrionaceae bacterium]